MSHLFGERLVICSVPKSGELRRIASLPRRNDPPPGSDRLSDVLRHPYGQQVLRPVQSWALAEILCSGGLFGPIRVGAGKTLITYLAPRMLDAKRPLLLIPAKLREKTRRDFEILAEHWESTPPEILSYEKLSRQNQATFLDDFNPDMIIGDEVHRLSNIRAGCTRRVGRFMSKHPDTPFVALSGTITKRSLMNFAHILEWCLGEGAPVPLTRKDLEDWARALDEENHWMMSRLSPGAIFSLEGKKLGTVEEARGIYRRRLEQTPGVVSTKGRGVTASLRVEPWTTPEHPGVTKALKRLRDLWETPDGQPLMTAVETWRHAREIVQGFWYRWEEQPPDEWLEARRVWAAFVRSVLLRSRTLDTPAQVAVKHREAPERLAWLKVRELFTPRTVAEWITQDVIAKAAQWAQEPGIIWVDSQAAGEALQALGVPYYGRMGRGPDGVIEDARGGIAASIAANSEGRNLQHYHRNLILSPPTTGTVWEQLLGRTHREGQAADTVTVEVFLGCAQSRKGFEQALADAAYQKGITGSEQKLLLADVVI